MHITQHTDYGLRVLIYLGTNTDRLVTIREVSECFGVSNSHLMKVVNQLIREKFVEGVRGKGGGLRLGCAAAAISVGDVVRRLERDMTLVECFGEGCNCLLDPTCKLKSTLANALQAFQSVLDQVTLADLLVVPETKVLRRFP
ncbi:MAG: BadM/Rrf2 family transcriptional regulator [Betaproteobacteria bacterium HGW-Betaproteobacteria-12]|nr:MAG: BadM/Rrf2 family transcriptional regulator [Betaproteobacteria bacterium HGW-Betaproteobacteria-12]